MKKKNIVFLPCRKGSQRVVDKNTRDFAGIQGGLLYIKLQQLLAAESIDEIILSSDDDKVFEVARMFADPRLQMVRRPAHLAQSSTLTDELIAYVPSIIEEGTVLWTHVTSPFLPADAYDKMFQAYYDYLDEYDSLMSVSPLRTFVWNKQNAVNYDRKKEKWPRTQTIEPLYEVNSGAFIADIDIYKRLHDRIGERVQMFELDFWESFDIDWPEDFELAEIIFKTRK